MKDESEHTNENSLLKFKRDRPNELERSNGPDEQDNDSDS